MISTRYYTHAQSKNKNKRESTGHDIVEQLWIDDGGRWIVYFVKRKINQVLVVANVKEEEYKKK